MSETTSCTWTWLFFFSFMSITFSQKYIPEFSGKQAAAVVAGADFVKQSAKEVSMEVSSWPSGIYVIALNTDSAYGSTFKLMMIH